MSALYGGLAKIEATKHQVHFQSFVENLVQARLYSIMYARESVVRRTGYRAHPGFMLRVTCRRVATVQGQLWLANDD